MLACQLSRPPSRRMSDDPKAPLDEKRPGKSPKQKARRRSPSLVDIMRAAGKKKKTGLKKKTRKR